MCEIVFFCSFFVGLGTYFCYKLCNTVTSLCVRRHKRMNCGIKSCSRGRSLARGEVRRRRHGRDAGPAIPAPVAMTIRSAAGRGWEGSHCTRKGIKWLREGGGAGRVRHHQSVSVCVCFCVMVHVCGAARRDQEAPAAGAFMGRQPFLVPPPSSCLWGLGSLRLGPSVKSVLL